MSEESARWVLAADIGGTHARLGMFAERDGELEAGCQRRYRVAEYDEPDELIGDFIDQCEHAPVAACLGVAGPVLAGRCRLTNLDWVLESEFLVQQLGLSRVELINDLEAMALGLDDLAPSARVTLRDGRPQGNDRVGLLAVGTGLGEALRFKQEGRVSVVAGEGGHADFAPARERDWALRGFLSERHGEHVSWERVLSGAGLTAIYEFLCQRDGREPVTRDESDPSATVIRRGLESGDAVCAEALAWFAELLGGEAGNLALRGLCVDGLYIGGGLPPRIQKLLESEEFLRAFTAKGRFRNLLEQVPVHLVLEDDAALFGAARVALRSPG